VEFGASWAAALSGGRGGWVINLLRGLCDGVSWGHGCAGGAVESALEVQVANPRENTCPCKGAGRRGRQEVVVVVVVVGVAERCGALLCWCV
jgi:hypothetical protein